MFLVTGGAGFIGSNVVASLDEAGYGDVVVNDTLGTGEKWHNLRKRRLADLVSPGELFACRCGCSNGARLRVRP